MLALYGSSGVPSTGILAMEEYDQNHLCHNKAIMFDDFADSSQFSHLDQRAAGIVYDHDHDHDQSPPSTTHDITDGDPTIVKKQNHNASERDRRKKINFLYSSLRALLPAADQMVLINITISHFLIH